MGLDRAFPQAENCGIGNLDISGETENLTDRLIFRSVISL
jgi:hypothetical protein